MKYYLHYVGSKLYPEEVFVKEAKQYGVNRCLPLRLLKHLKFGDRILTGSYIAKTINQEQIIDLEGKKVNSIDGRKNKRDGTAKIFGYFIISGLNVIASDEFKKALASQLTIIETKDNNTSVQRQCGSYIIGTSYTITNELSDVICKVEQLILEKKEAVKVFITGAFKAIKAEISPVNFSRTIIPVEIADELPIEEISNCIGFIYDYNKRKYIKKYEKAGRPKKDKQNE